MRARKQAFGALAHALASLPTLSGVLPLGQQFTPQPLEQPNGTLDEHIEMRLQGYVFSSRASLSFERGTHCPNTSISRLSL